MGTFTTCEIKRLVVLGITAKWKSGLEADSTRWRTTDVELCVAKLACDAVGAHGARTAWLLKSVSLVCDCRSVNPWLSRTGLTRPRARSPLNTEAVSSVLKLSLLLKLTLGEIKSTLKFRRTVQFERLSGSKSIGGELSIPSPGSPVSRFLLGCLCSTFCIRYVYGYAVCHLF